MIQLGREQPGTRVSPEVAEIMQRRAQDVIEAARLARLGLSAQFNLSEAVGAHVMEQSAELNQPAEPTVIEMAIPNANEPLTEVVSLADRHPSSPAGNVEAARTLVERAYNEAA